MPYCLCKFLIESKGIYEFVKLGLKGLTTPNENKIPVKKAILQSSKQNILVTDSSKYGKVATFFVCPLTVFDQIIFDNGLFENVQEALKGLGIKFNIA